MSHSLRRVLAAAVIGVLALVLTGCTSDDGPTNEEPEAKPTPLSAFDAGSVALTRTDFCDYVSEAAVEDAVGKVDSTNHYGNGEEVEIGQKMDISHEFSCGWTGDKGTARAWVFVPRITEARAQALVREQVKTKGCRRVEGAFGQPSVGTVCTQPGDQGGAGGTTEASYRGLFVDSWITCTLERPQANKTRLVELTGEWCVAAAKAAGTS